MIHIVTTTISNEPQYGPTIIWIMGGAAPFIIAFGVWVNRSLQKQTTLLAVLTSETRPAIKLVNEVIDLKLASAELNEKAKSVDNQFEDLKKDIKKVNDRIDKIWDLMKSDIEDTKTRDRIRKAKEND